MPGKKSATAGKTANQKQKNDHLSSSSSNTSSEKLTNIQLQKTGNAEQNDFETIVMDMH